MNRTLLVLALLAAFAAAPTQAQNLQERVETLSKEVVELRDQVALLRSMLSRDSTGNVTVTSTTNRKDQVGNDFSASVGGNASSSFARSVASTIAQSRSTQVGGNDLLTVTGSSTSNIGGNWNLSVNGSAAEQVANSLSVSAAREILFKAGDQITLKTGDSTLVMKKDGSIAISGKTFSVNASGDVVIKGSKVLTN